MSQSDPESPPSQRPLRIAVVGAFPFPLAQGSQVFARDQLRALQAAGAEVRLLCYGHGEGATPDDFPVARIPSVVSPRSLRAGPNFKKPLADAWLAGLLVQTARSARFDAVLAHNVEAALVSLVTRPFHRSAVVYVAHTLMGQELSSYRDRYASSFVSRCLDRLGARLDTALARHCDAVLALSSQAAAVLGEAAGNASRIRVIPPGHAPRPPPDSAKVAAACARHGLVPGGFALYTGNLDGYQDLGDLAESARRLAPYPVVIASHGSDADRDAFVRRHPGPLRLLRVDADEARRLVFGCAVAVLPRRRAGGFPIKLLSYMEAQRPIVARRTAVDGFRHAESAWLLEAEAGVDALASAVTRIVEDPALARRLGRGAGKLLEERHDERRAAEQTLELIRAAAAFRAGSRRGSDQSTRRRS